MKSLKHLLFIFFVSWWEIWFLFKNLFIKCFPNCSRNFQKVLRTANQILAQNAFRIFFQQETTKNGISETTFIKQNFQLVAAN